MNSKENKWLKPSVWSHILNGVFMLITFVIIVSNWSKLMKLDVYRILIVVLLLSIVAGVHSLSHLGLEKEYDIGWWSVFQST